MSISHSSWAQIKSITATELMSALTKDDWSRDVAGGSIHIYTKDTKRVSVHFHPKKTFGPKLLKGLIEDTGWTDNDLRRLKLVK